MMKYAVGQSVPRSEDPRLLKGYGNYIDDVNLSFQAPAFMLRAPMGRCPGREALFF